MPARPAQLLAHVRRLALPSDSDTDAALLDRFARSRDGDAFAALVRRHGPMVYGVCRRVLHDAHAAEDAAQAAFLMLARKAAALRDPDRLAAWLHGTAHHLALNCRKADARRRRREGTGPLPAPASPRDPLEELTARELLAFVDEEVRRLPEVYRLPVILCCLEGHSQEEAARRLGWSPGSVKGRLERGRARLHARLVRRGLTLGAALAAVEVSRGAATGVPAQEIVRAGLAFTAEHVGGERAAQRAAVLAEEALRGAAASRLQAVAALAVLGAGLAVAAAGALAHHGAAAPGPAAQDRQPARPEERPQARADRYGDPLPEGAVTRLGTVRFRVPDEVEALTFSPDGKSLAVYSRAGVFLLDAADGKRLRELAALAPPLRRQGLLAFSPDGKRLAGRGSITEGNRFREVVRVWDLAGGGQPKVHGTEHAVWTGWSADGEPLAICLEAGALRLDELASGRSRRFACKDLPEPGLSDHVLCTCAPAGRTLAAPDQQGLVHVWDTATGRERCAVRPRGPYPRDLALSPDGRTLASLSSSSEGNGPAQLWDTATGKALHSLATGQRYLAAVIFAPDGKTLATAGGADVRFWDVATGRAQGRTQGGRFGFDASIAFSPDGRTLATAERNLCAVRLWDVATGKPHPEPVGHGCRPHGTAFAPDGRRVATGGGLDGTIHIWDLETGESVAQVRRAPEWVRDVAFSRDGRSLSSTWTGEDLWVCDAATGVRRAVLKLEDPDWPDTRQSAISMYPSADGERLVAFSYYYPKKNGAGPRHQETLITGWDKSTRKQLFRRRLPGMDSWLALSADARVLAVASPGDRADLESVPGKGPMRLEDVATGALLLTFPAPEGQTWPLAFSPDGRLLASNNSDYKRRGKAGDPAGATGNVLRLWETATGAEVLVLPASDNDKAAFSADGRLLAVSAPAQEIIVWDLARGRECRRFKGLGADVTYLAFAPDGRRVVSGLSDSTLLVWDAVPRDAAPAGTRGAAGLAKAWADLAGSDAGRAFRARWALAAAPEEALPLLKERLRPARATDQQRLRRLLADLDSDQFEVRQEAQAALEGLSDLDGPALRQVLANRPTPEVRRRVEAVLDRLRGPVTLPEALRSLRAVAVLEDIATPPARQVLEDVAAGAPGARLTQEAKASLQRLTRRLPAER
jgi:RNA polymerase sigma factor (sigma-70 family)